MVKRKLIRFAEMETFNHVVQAPFDEVFQKDYKLKGNWNKDFFKNNNPIILELGCGKGEYTVGLARQNTEINFIGVDIKGARMWRGAKTAIESGMKNVGFLRTRIDLINSFFAESEISEIWITFPDPQPKKQFKRLTSTRFLGYYQKLIVQNGIIHLKTDSAELYAYTQKLVELNKLEIDICTDNLYNSEIVDPVLSIKTFYEQQFLMKGKPITYIKFKLDIYKNLEEPEEE
ncbi:MAG: tRNA (guanosine(46)-N7)-methyltransferase TrmB [Bacteroidetes bacterium GWC2_33_15]|nr:MAG: tRNA (guanosine(46)-N7)-methyltransferase TrmB [Bacteroidetes bacterium GWC2_33_15]OFX63011.1 MAG: tRNA (guanosine(46)-N7)-methyltransferase TrmB [Bacteroidetes bacterium GWB2_32_14]OFX68744.1 MAG: tRNA (guanosine(46)-N7)-methyltransferase TrmB [Bacteroidetes bacterium GWD2_33_33]